MPGDQRHTHAHTYAHLRPIRSRSVARIAPVRRTGVTARVAGGWERRVGDQRRPSAVARSVGTRATSMPIIRGNVRVCACACACAYPRAYAGHTRNNGMRTGENDHCLWDWYWSVARSLGRWAKPGGVSRQPKVNTERNNLGADARLRSPIGVIIMASKRVSVCVCVCAHGMR